MPVCSKCGAPFEQTEIKPIADCAENEACAEVRCTNGHLLIVIQRPSQEAIDFGRELAARYGW